MRRLLPFIAILFAFASLAGTTLAHAHRYVSTPIVVLNHVDENNVAIPVVVQVQRGTVDLGSGIIMPCGPHHAIGVSAPQLPPAPDCQLSYWHDPAADPKWPARTPLRPPKSI